MTKRLLEMAMTLALLGLFCITIGVDIHFALAAIHAAFSNQSAWLPTISFDKNRLTTCRFLL